MKARQDFELARKEVQTDEGPGILECQGSHAKRISVFVRPGVGVCKVPGTVAGPAIKGLVGSVYSQNRRFAQTLEMNFASTGGLIDVALEAQQLQFKLAAVEAYCAYCRHKLVN